MMVTSKLFLAFLYLCCGFLAISCWTIREPESPKDFVGRYEEITNIVLYPIEGSTTKTNVLCKGIHLEFDCFGNHFSYDLEIFDMFAEDAVETIITDKGTFQRKPTIKTFHHGSEIRIVVFDLKKKYFSGYFVSQAELYFIEEVDDGKLIAVSAHQIKQISELFPKDKNDSFVLQPRLDEDGLKTANELNVPPIVPASSVSGCPQTRQKIELSFGADIGFYNAFNGLTRSASDEIDHIMTKSTAVYEYTVNTRLVLKEKIIQTTTGGPTWNVQRPSCPNIQDLLNIWTSWVRSNRASSDSAAWHLMTDCYPPPGTVGVAWVGALCSSSRTGVNSLTRDFRGRVGATSWTTFAHELGHNFNAPHTWGNGPVQSSDPNNEGLMSYRGDAAAFTRNSQTIMCSYVGRTRSSSRTRTCFQDDDGGSTCQCEPGFCGTCGVTNCGPCPNGYFCDTDNYCKRQCTKTCRTDVSKPCGIDGCGGTCGTCNANEICQSGECVVSSAQKDTYLALHNEERQKVGVPLMTWSDSLATLAQNAGCGLSANRDIQSQGLGENVIGIRGTINNPTLIINSYWTQESVAWTCESNVLNRYTQMIWSTSTKLGCAIVSGCDYRGTAYETLRCVYEKGGNIPGQKPVPSCGNTCTPSQTCGFRRCGQIDDGCGNALNCGTCGSTDTCVNGQCVCNKRTQCFSSECGDVSDGCGGILNCGACPTPPPCTPKSISVACMGKNCGEVSDGCGNLLFCGACNGNQSCEANKCTGCISCAPQATCVQDQCICREGYTGDGTTCVPNPDIGNPDDPINNPPPSLNWNPVFDSSQGSWQVLADSIVHTQKSDSTSRDMIKWDDTLRFSFTTKVTFAVQAWKEKDEDFGGLLLRYKDEGNMLYMIWERNTVRFRWLFKESGFRSEDKYVIEQQVNPSWNGGEWRELKVEIEGDTYTFNTDQFRRLRYTLRLPRELPTGPFGLVANGQLKFDNVTIYTSSRVQLQLFGCLSEEEFKERVAQVLRIQSNRIVNFDDNGCATSQKRQQGSVVTYSFDLLGSSSANSEASSSLLQGYVATSDFSLSSGSMQSASEAQVVQRPPPSDSKVVTVALPASAAATGLGAGAIAGIVIASIVAAGGAAGGAAYGVKKYRDSQKEREEPNPVFTQTEEQPPSPQGSSIKGVDVYSFNSDKITSITARSPPQNKA